MKELESVIGKLEHGEATLEQSIALYERGAKLRAHCERRYRNLQPNQAARPALDRHAAGRHQHRVRVAGIIVFRVERDHGDSEH